MKDWTGNKNSIFTTLGSSAHANQERAENDYYATEPRVIDELFNVEDFSGKTIWECACGEGHLSKEISKYGEVLSTDLIFRGYGMGGVDFLKSDKKWNGHIITNPPYKYAKEFCQKAIELIEEGNKVAMFLKITFLEGQKRRKFFDKYPPKTIYVYSSRRSCARNGEFDKFSSSASCYAWFIWEKGFTGDPIIKWI